MDRRAAFFLIAAVVSAALVPLVPHEHGKPYVGWVGWVLAIVLAVLAVASWLDRRAFYNSKD